MAVMKRLFTTGIIKKTGWLIGILLLGNASMAGTPADTSKKLLLASNTKSEAVYITQPANIVFPELLKGNEEQSLSYIENFSNKRHDYLVRMYTKGKKLLNKAAGILNKYHMPAEFKVLLTLESAYNAEALSCAGAVGYWQIMDEVAKEYGLKYAEQLDPAEMKKLFRKNPKKADSLKKAMAKVKDDRKNFIKSTTAAARYLNDRRKNLDDNWLLIAASYNCGVGNVWEAMRKSGKAHPDFWDIKHLLPAETQNYVMNFITLNVIFHNYSKFANNTLTFSPTKILVKDNFEQNMSEALDEHLVSN